MGAYLRGNALTIVERFLRLDPVTKVPESADPTTVTFTVIDPDGVSTDYVYGVDTNVTRFETGGYLCALETPLPPGDYLYGCVGTGHVQAAMEGTFTILPGGTQAPVFPTTAQYGPCNSWVDGGYVADWDGTLGVGSSSYLLDTAAEMASQLMYELTARQFAGTCQRKVRPCRQTCACFGLSLSLGLGPWYWTTAAPGIGGWGWRNECGDGCGCGNESYLRLAGYPVQRILEVKIDGEIIDPSEYRLDERRNLIRMADTSTTPPTDRSWPVCQDLSLDDTEPGTFSVVYEWGMAPPELGKQAAAQLAVELWRGAPGNDGVCRLPNKVTRIVRQGIEMDRVVSMADALREGATGLQLVDAFIALVNPQKAKMRSAVFSPDVPRFGRQVGQDEYGT